MTPVNIPRKMVTRAERDRLFRQRLLSLKPEQRIVALDNSKSPVYRDESDAMPRWWAIFDALTPEQRADYERRMEETPPK